MWSTLSGHKNGSSDTSELPIYPGCVSVRRIAAELVPRYAVFCPTALDLAARTTLQLSDWSCGLIRKGGKEGEGLAGETAEACFHGLVNIAAAAVTAAFELSSLSAMCTEVCRNIYMYLLRQLDGRQLNLAYETNVQEEDRSTRHEAATKADDIDLIADSVGPKKLDTLITSSMLQIFTCDPQGVLSACLELLRATDGEHRRDGQHFLAQILKLGAHPNLDARSEEMTQVNAIMKKTSQFLEGDTSWPLDVDSRPADTDTGQMRKEQARRVHTSLMKMVSFKFLLNAPNYIFPLHCAMSANVGKEEGKVETYSECGVMV